MELHSQEEDTALTDLYSGLGELWVGGENHADKVWSVCTVTRDQN